MVKRLNVKSRFYIFVYVNVILLNRSVPLVTSAFISFYSIWSTRASSSFYGPIFIKSHQKTMNKTQYSLF